MPNVATPEEKRFPITLTLAEISMLDDILVDVIWASDSNTDESYTEFSEKLRKICTSLLR
jgi:hypothetical protein